MSESNGKARSRAAAFTHRAAIAAHRAVRLARWAADPAAFPPPLLAPPPEQFPFLLGSETIPIVRVDPFANPLFESGKRINIALAAPAFDGLLVTPSRPLSFWRTLGDASAELGFRAGMELSGGCIVPAIGGGLCLLSNALFRAAAHLGWNILERHGHTLEAIPPAPGELRGLDATVFHPYVDLRIAPRSGAARLGLQVKGDQLLFEVRADRPSTVRSELTVIDERMAGDVRENRILRSLFSAQGSGPALDEEIIAVNRTRLLHPAEYTRTCLSCGETACPDRAPFLARVGR